MPTPTPPRRGFNMIENLFVIAIIAVLISLLLPAVQQAREAARRTQCKNHMKQLALALHNYHDTYNAFPSGSSAKLYSPFVAVMPYIDLANNLRAYNFNESYSSATNVAVINQTIPVFLCPTMTIPRAVPELTCPEAGAAGSYAVCAGTTARGFDGVFIPDGSYDPTNGRVVRMADITDGTTNTIFIGEFNYKHAGYTWTSASNSCAGNPALAGTVRWGSARWGGGYAGLAVGGMGGVFNKFSGNVTTDRETFRSDHVGGGQFAMGDGSVRFINDSINSTILLGLSTRAGGEIVGEF